MAKKPGTPCPRPSRSPRPAVARPCRGGAVHGDAAAGAPIRLAPVPRLRPSGRKEPACAVHDGPRLPSRAAASCLAIASCARLVGIQRVDRGDGVESRGRMIGGVDDDGGRRGMSSRNPRPRQARNSVRRTVAQNLARRNRRARKRPAEAGRRHLPCCDARTSRCGDQFWNGVFSAKYSWLSALSSALVGLLIARFFAPVWP